MFSNYLTPASFNHPDTSAGNEAMTQEKQSSLESSVVEIQRQHAPVESTADLAVVMISRDFDIVMANRMQQTLIGKSSVELMGQKCYREFEKRETPCPNCPAIAALSNQKPHQAERMAIPDTGKPYRLIVTAYPVFGPNNETIGFVEIAERIHELGQFETLMALAARLQGRLAEAHTLVWILRHALDVALSVEGVDMGCAYVQDSAGSGVRSISNRGLPRAWADQILRAELASPAQQSSIPRPCPAFMERGESVGGAVLVPVLHRGQSVGGLIVGMSNSTEFSPAALATFTCIGALASCATLGLRRSPVTSP